MCIDKQKLTVRKSQGIQVQHWHDRFIFVDVLTGYTESGKPLFSGTKMIPYPPEDIEYEQLFTITRNGGKIRMIPYLWRFFSYAS